MWRTPDPTACTYNPACVYVYACVCAYVYVCVLECVCVRACMFVCGVYACMCGWVGVFVAYPTSYAYILRVRVCECVHAGCLCACVVCVGS